MTRALRQESRRKACEGEPLNGSFEEGITFVPLRKEISEYCVINNIAVRANLKIFRIWQLFSFFSRNWFGANTIGSFR